MTTICPGGLELSSLQSMTRMARGEDPMQGIYNMLADMVVGAFMHGYTAGWGIHMLSIIGVIVQNIFIIQNIENIVLEQTSTFPIYLNFPWLQTFLYRYSADAW